MTRGQRLLRLFGGVAVGVMGTVGVGFEALITVEGLTGISPAVAFDKEGYFLGMGFRTGPDMNPQSALDEAKRSWLVYGKGCIPVVGYNVKTSKAEVVGLGCPWIEEKEQPPLRERGING